MTEFIASVVAPQAFQTNLRFVGDFAVWAEPATADFLIYDPDTRGIRRFKTRSAVAVE